MNGKVNIEKNVFMMFFNYCDLHDYYISLNEPLF